MQLTMDANMFGDPTSEGGKERGRSRVAGRKREGRNELGLLERFGEEDSLMILSVLQSYVSH